MLLLRAGVSVHCLHPEGTAHLISRAGAAGPPRRLAAPPQGGAAPLKCRGTVPGFGAALRKGVPKHRRAELRVSKREALTEATNIIKMARFPKFWSSSGPQSYIKEAYVLGSTCLLKFGSDICPSPHFWVTTCGTPAPQRAGLWPFELIWGRAYFPRHSLVGTAKNK